MVVHVGVFLQSFCGISWGPSKNYPSNRHQTVCLTSRGSRKSRDLYRRIGVQRGDGGDEGGDRGGVVVVVMVMVIVMVKMVVMMVVGGGGDWW